MPEVEMWRPCPAAETIYAVSNFGRVMRTVDGGGCYRAGRLLKAAAHGKTGYMKVTIYPMPRQPKTVLVHRLVCEAFHGPAPTQKHEVAHGDGVRANCAARNLSWKTHSENMLDMAAHGTAGRSRGSDRPNAKLTEAEVLEIRYLRAGGCRVKDIAATFGLHQSAISRITTGLRWRWLHAEAA